jgi:hypothetical protein
MVKAFLDQGIHSWWGGPGMEDTHYKATTGKWEEPAVDRIPVQVKLGTLWIASDTGEA